jgi:polyhydroxyalkanoate synthesis regulator phasin
MSMHNEVRGNGHTESMPRATDAYVARIESRIAKIEASGEQRVNALRDAVGEFIDGELTPRDEQIAASNEEIATLKKRVADLEHKVAQQAAVVQ